MQCSGVTQQLGHPAGEPGVGKAEALGDGSCSFIGCHVAHCSWLQTRQSEYTLVFEYRKGFGHDGREDVAWAMGQSHCSWAIGVHTPCMGSIFGKGNPWQRQDTDDRSGQWHVIVCPREEAMPQGRTQRPHCFTGSEGGVSPWTGHPHQVRAGWGVPPLSSGNLSRWHVFLPMAHPGSAQATGPQHGMTLPTEICILVGD